MSQFSSSPSSIRSSVSPPCSSPISARYLSRRKSKKSISDVIPERGFTGSTSNHNGRPRKMAHPFTDNNNDGHDKMFEGGGEEFGSINEEYYCREEEERGPSSSHRTVYNFSDRYRFSRIVIDDCLIFDANFESGNLMSAKRIYFGDYRDDNPAFQEYDLEMNYDAQSKVGTSTQWFFFSIASSCSFPSKPVTVKFNIINFTKSDSLYNYGMKPLCYNKKEGWKRVGKDVRYYGNQFKLSKEKKNKQFYTLTFSFELSRSSTVHYFAACFPYTYFDLQKFLYNLQIDPQRQCFVKRDLLCETLAGNRCDLLTITEPSSLKDRKIVVVTGRVHPGESNASWMVQGIIDFITGETEEARELRSLYIFKIIPMMNPDGVINGNYRNSLAGIDLNRCWDHPDPTFHPTIHKTKELIKNLQSRQGVSLLCDFHGHSRKEGLFVFGCIPDFDHDKRDHKNLIFPQMFDRASDFFRLDKCNFSISSKKAATMRLAMYNFGIERAYTVEASMSGIDGKHYSIVDLLEIGHDFCNALFEFSRLDQTTNKPCIPLERSISISSTENDLYNYKHVLFKKVPRQQENKRGQHCPEDIRIIDNMKDESHERNSKGATGIRSSPTSRTPYHLSDYTANNDRSFYRCDSSGVLSTARKQIRTSNAVKRNELLSLDYGRQIEIKFYDKNQSDSCPVACSFLIMGSPICEQSLSLGKGLPIRKIPKFK